MKVRKEWFYRGYYPVWTTIGVFEALRPLKNKSCDYKNISEKENYFCKSIYK